MFSCEFCQISKNTFFTEHLRWLLLELNIFLGNRERIRHGQHVEDEFDTDHSHHIGWSHHDEIDTFRGNEGDDYER